MTFLNFPRSLHSTKEGRKAGATVKIFVRGAAEVKATSWLFLCCVNIEKKARRRKKEGGRRSPLKKPKWNWKKLLQWKIKVYWHHNPLCISSSRPPKMADKVRKGIERKNKTFFVWIWNEEKIFRRQAWNFIFEPTHISSSNTNDNVSSFQMVFRSDSIQKFVVSLYQ